MKKTSSINQPIIFLRVAWMEKYDGVSENDIPRGAGSYVTENQNGGEVNNFTLKKGKYYGYARIQNNRTINLLNLGGTKTDSELSGVTVVFFARNPIDGGQWIVGWYKNATIYKDLVECPKKDKNDWGVCLATCNAKDGRLLNLDERNWEVEGAGQSNLWYPEKYLSKSELKELKEFIQTGKFKVIGKKTDTNIGGGWIKDAELRKKIEIAAMDKVFSFYTNKGFKCSYVHKENKGWDMEISKGKRLFQVEIKGTQYDFKTVELTPNEFTMMNKLKSTYRVCIVSHALDAQKQTLESFHFNGTIWVNESNKELNINTIKSAKLSLL